MWSSRIKTDSPALPSNRSANPFLSLATYQSCPLLLAGRDERCESQISGRRGAPPSRLGGFTQCKSRGSRICRWSLEDTRPIPRVRILPEIKKEDGRSHALRQPSPHSQFPILNSLFPRERYCCLALSSAASKACCKATRSSPGLSDSRMACSALSCSLE